MVCFTFAPCKTIARQIYFLYRNDIVYLFVKKHFRSRLYKLNKVMLYPDDDRDATPMQVHTGLQLGT